MPLSSHDYLTETYKLNSGYELPKEGYGTWLTPDADCPTLVNEAIHLGYRLIDTAHDYNNEQGVGQGIHGAMKELGLKREDLFITTKVDANVLTHAEAAASISESLEKLQVDYVDLVLIHAPRPWDKMDKDPGPDGDHYYEKNKEVWSALEDAVKAQRVRSIGLSQFSVDDMNHLMEHAAMCPAVLQTLAFAGDMPWDLMKYCHDEGIQLQAFCPLGHGRALDNADLEKIAGHYDASASQLCLRYLIQEGFSVIPKSTKVAHMRENTHLSFTITDDDIAVINKLDLANVMNGL